MADTTEQYMRRRARYEHLDGTGELTFGIWMFVFAFFGRLSEGVAMSWQWWLMVYGTIGAVWAGTHFGTRYIRRRLVYPHYGYAVFRKRPWIVVFTVLLSAVVAAVLVLWLGRAQSIGLSPPLLFGLLNALAILVGALWHHVERLVVMAPVSIAAGFVVHYLEPTLSGTYWYFLAMGTAFLISGAVTLYRYVHRMPRRDLEAEE